MTRSVTLPVWLLLLLVVVTGIVAGGLGSLYTLPIEVALA
jgi:hypothetical protein